jgi:Transglycosylase SLT domain/D-alanyl-D-alanine carboxypeptidase
MRQAPSTGRRRLGRQVGQALPLVLGAAVILIVVALALVALAGALTGTARAQRGSDLAALSAARSMRDDLWRLLAPPRLPNGLPNPVHMPKAVYLARASAAAREAAVRNGIDPGRLRVWFPDRVSPAPLRARVAVRAEIELPDGTSGGSFQSEAEAHAALPAGFTGAPSVASGGGYQGPLAYRQGKGMRPDAAAAFDRLAAAATGAGHALVITSAYRSDAEQARLFAQNPDPRWVAPPGKSLHRCGTELDLGPDSAYGWLAANASRFGFVKRYSWEPWHFGYVGGPAPCSTVAPREPDGRAAGAALPAFVPAPFRAPIERAAARWGVSAGLLAAQLAAESNFDPDAVSPAGAQGIAQFMPATAAAYGLRDPFDPEAAIDAQAHLMSDLLERFASIPLALAAYNAGPGAVAACTCVPAYPETQAYVARILGLMGAAGELAVPALEVRLVD